MKIVFAIDSFKGSLSSLEAGNAAAEGARRAFPDATCVVRPLADGGEGTVEALAAGLGGELRTVTVTAVVCALSACSIERCICGAATRGSKICCTSSSTTRRKRYLSLGAISFCKQ